MEQDETERKSSPRTARELCRELGYKRWENFLRVTDKAVDGCRKAGQNVEEHFRCVPKMVCTGSGAQRMVHDYELSPYACYLIAKYADQRKESVQNALDYFLRMVYRKEEVEEEHPTPAHAATSQAQDPLPVLLFLPVENGGKCLIIRKIAWIEDDGSYVHFHMTDGREEIARCSLETVLQQLHDRGIDFFVRINNSYAINVNHIELKNR